MAVFMGGFGVPPGEGRGSHVSSLRRHLVARMSSTRRSSDAALRRSRGCCRRAPRDRW